MAIDVYMVSFFSPYESRARGVLMHNAEATDEQLKAIERFVYVMRRRNETQAEQEGAEDLV